MSSPDSDTGGRRLRTAAARIALLLATVFALVVIAIWVFQERVVFLPPAVPHVQGRGSVRVDYAAADGQPLFGFLVEPKGRAGGRRDSTTGAIIVFHGNGDLADSWVDWAHEAAARIGWPVFLAEYRGYGGLTGRPTFAGVARDANAAFDGVARRYALRPDRIVLYGHSLGSGVVTNLATQRGARAIVLEAPMTSLVDMGRRTFGPPISWVLPLISRSPFTPIAQVRATQAPVWIAIGGRDDVIPAEMGRAVFAAAARQGELLEVADARHGDISDRGGERYWQWLLRAVRAEAPLSP
jgi:uncharacterized protein